MAKIVRETLPRMICGFCTIYRETPSGDRFDKGERYCPAIKNTTFAHDKICKGFILHRDFYCQKNDYWVDNEVCLNRRDKGAETCRRCNQGKMLEDYVNLKKQEGGG